MMRPLLLLLASLVGFSWLSLDLQQEGVENSLTIAAESALNEHGYRGITVRFDHLDGIVTGAETTKQLDEVRELILTTIPAGRIVFAQTRGDDSSSKLVSSESSQTANDHNVDSDISGPNFDAAVVFGELTNDTMVVPDDVMSDSDEANITKPTTDAVIEPSFKRTNKAANTQAQEFRESIQVKTDREPELEAVTAADISSARDRVTEVDKVDTQHTWHPTETAPPIYLTEFNLDAMKATVEAQGIGNDTAERTIVTGDPKLQSDLAPQLVIEPAMNPDLEDAPAALNENAEPMTRPQVTEKPVASALLIKPTAAHRPANTGRPRLGVYLTAHPNDPVVRHIDKGSAAELAGIRVGDSIVRFGNRNITNYAELSAAVLKYVPGEMADVLLKRNGELVRRTVKLQHAESATTTDKASPEAIESVQ